LNDIIIQLQERQFWLYCAFEQTELDNLVAFILKSISKRLLPIHYRIENVFKLFEVKMGFFSTRDLSK
jgi:hypothetical protein